MVNPGFLIAGGIALAGVIGYSIIAPIPTPKKPSELLNPLLKSLERDYYYHLGLDSDMDLSGIFGDVRCVICYASTVKALRTAKAIQSRAIGQLIGPIGSTERFTLYKVGAILVVGHGMGKPTLSIFLHEITKVLARAGSLDQTTYIRCGTSGGIGVENGTVVVTTQVLDGALNDRFPMIVLGKRVWRDCRIDPIIVEEIMSIGVKVSKFPIVKGKTISADDFYEGEGRMDGAINVMTDKKRVRFLKKAYRKGVRNVEMEANQLVAFCTKLNIPCAVICFTIDEQIGGDGSIGFTEDEIYVFADNTTNVMLSYVEKEILGERR